MLFLTLTERQPERSPHLRVVPDPHRKTAWEISTFMCCSWPSQKDSLRDLHIYVLFLTLTERQPERSPHWHVVLDPHKKTAWEWDISTFTCCSWLSPKDSLRDLHIYMFFLTPTERQPERSPHLHVFLTLTERQPERSPHLHVFLTLTERQPERSPHLHVFLTLTERQPERYPHLHVVPDPLRKTAWEISTFMCCSWPSQKDSLRDPHIDMLFLTLTERQPERSPHWHVVLDPHRKTAWDISTFTCCSWPSQKDSLRDHIYVLFLTLTERQPERSPHLCVVLDPHRKTAWEISTFMCCSWPSQKDSLRDLQIYVLFLTLTERQPERSPHLCVVLDPHRKTAWEISTFMCCSWPSQKDSLRDLHIYVLFLTLTERQPERSPDLCVILLCILPNPHFIFSMEPYST